MSDSDRLKEERLVFYREDGAKMEGVLRDLLSLSGAKCAMLIDKDGHLVVRAGAMKGFDLDTVAALVAGSFAATREMARLLGEDQFSVLFHQGKRDNIQLSLIGDRTILTVIFDDATTVGMVRLYVNEAGRRLSELFDAAKARPRSGDQVKLDPDYANSGKDRLESMFPKP